MRSLVSLGGGVGGHCQPLGRRPLRPLPLPPPSLAARRARREAAAAAAAEAAAEAAPAPVADPNNDPPAAASSSAAPWRYDPDPSARPALDETLLRAAVGPGWWPLPGGLGGGGDKEPSASSPPQPSSNQKSKKRAVALHVAYLGTPFRGSQLLRDPSGPQATAEATVEGMLERALLRCGAMAPSNYGDLRRVGWSRASRTDKGVHSLGTVVGLRALVDESRFDGDPEGLWLADQVNEALALSERPAAPGAQGAAVAGGSGGGGAPEPAAAPPPPPPILVLSAQRVTKRFDCRRWAIGRAYEYYLPASALGIDLEQQQEEEKEEEAEEEEERERQGSARSRRRLGRGPVALTPEQAAVVARFKQALATLEGHHPFHNYAGRRKQYASTPAKEAARAAVPTVRERVAARRRADEEAARAAAAAAASAEAAAGAAEAATLTSPSSSSSLESSPLSPSSSVDTADDQEDDDANDDDNGESATAAAAPRPRRVEPFERRCWFLEQPDPRDPVSAAHYRTVTRLAVIPWGPADDAEEEEGAKEEEGGIPGGNDAATDKAATAATTATASNDVVRLVDGGVPCLRVRVEGASFMLNQIRNMVGSAVACARGQLPPSLLEASLSARVRAAMVKAPPHTLVLADTTFSPFATAYGTTTTTAEGAGSSQQEGAGGVARWSGERLELRGGGRKRQWRWRRDVLAGAVQELLLHEDWRFWAEEELPRLSWPAADEVARRDAEWQVAERRRKEEDKARREERQRQQEREERQDTECAGSAGGGGFWAWVKSMFVSRGAGE
jgi:tRNA pseudouridine38-40 synthase